MFITAKKRITVIMLGFLLCGCSGTHSVTKTSKQQIDIGPAKTYEKVNAEQSVKAPFRRK